MCWLSIVIIKTTVAVNTPQGVIPFAGQNLTDVAVHFQFWGCNKCTKYQFQLSPSIDFPVNSQLINITTPPDDQTDKTSSLWTSCIGINTYFPPLYANNNLPTPGIWYWRVKGFVNVTWQPSDWSTPIKIYINNNYEPSNNVIRTIDNNSPLFEFEIWHLSASQVGNFNNKFPSELLKYMAVSYDARKDQNSTLLHEFLMPAIKANMPILIDSEAGPHYVSYWESLAEIEYIFQNYNNIYGVKEGEIFWNFYWYNELQDIKQSYIRAIIILCAKYGKYFIWGDGEELYYAWSRLAADPKWNTFLQKYSKHIIFTPKSNIIPHWYPSYSATLGKLFVPIN